jgi:DNA-directed RNA polymerase specialized sigma24 family protein
LRHTLREFLDLSPDRFKQVFVMSDIENESTENICKELNLNVSNFSEMMYRASSLLKDCFLKKGFSSLSQNKK